MGPDSRPAQIVALTIIVAAILGFLWLTGVWGQTPKPVINKPIVTDQVVQKTETLRVVGKDEIQRILDDMTLRMQKSEDEVSKLKRRVKALETQ